MKRKSLKILFWFKIKLEELIHDPQFNGKTVKIRAYVEKKGRCKVKLLNAKQKKNI